MPVLTVFFSFFPPMAYLRSETNSPPGEDILTQPLPSVIAAVIKHLSASCNRDRLIACHLSTKTLGFFSAIKQEKVT